MPAMRNTVGKVCLSAMTLAALTLTAGVGSKLVQAGAARWPSQIAGRCGTTR